MEKKYLIIIAVSVTVILCIIGCIFFFNTNTTMKDVIVKSSDNKFSVNIPNTVKYQINSKENNEFVIDLFSKSDEMYIYASTINSSRDLDLYQVAR